MIGVKIDFQEVAGVKTYLVNLAGKIEHRRELNKSLAIRLRRELQEHFRSKNAVPNKMGATKTNFWNQVADATDILEITESGATVQVAEQRYNIQLFGGTILPVKAKALTIPLIPEARGESVASYKLKTGRELFTTKKRNALFETTTGGEIRPVFALVKRATIQADPTALPPPETLLSAMQDEADDFIEALNSGTLA